MSVGVVRIGVLGCGLLARAVHLPVLACLPGARVVALAEPNPERRTEACRLVPTATAHAEAGEVLAHADVDAVVVCLPPGLHAGAALAALGAGKHLYLEKPVATTSAEAGAVLDAWRSSVLVGMMGFNYRRNPLYAALHAALRGGAIGQPVAMRTAFTTAAHGVPAAWRRHRAEGGGVLRDLAPHHVDLVRHLLDEEIAEVSAATVASRRTEDDTATLELRTAGGVPVQCLFAAHAVEEDRIEIVGEAGTLTVDRYRSLAVAYRPPEARRARAARLRDGLRALAGLGHLREKRRSPWHEPSYRRALTAFVTAVAAGRSAPVMPDLEDGYRALAVVEAAEAAAGAGRRVAMVEGAAALPGPGGADRAVIGVS